LVARNEEKLKTTLQELASDSGQQHDYLVADFSAPDDLQRVVAQYPKRASVVILVNNTGGPPAGLIADAATGDFVRAFASHLLCNHLLMQAFTPGMKRAGYGRIINIISTSVKIPAKGLGVSNTTRGAVANWSKTLASELGPHGITVNNVLPGATMTARLQEVIQSKVLPTGRSFDELTQEMVAEIPAGRIGEAREVAAAVAFLATPAAAYINGINIPVDGGRTGSL
jgi:3-oxoacyl-[acyl-carrier protein] reductase